MSKHGGKHQYPKVVGGFKTPKPKRTRPTTATTATRIPEAPTTSSEGIERPSGSLILESGLPAMIAASKNPNAMVFYGFQNGASGMTIFSAGVTGIWTPSDTLLDVETVATALIFEDRQHPPMEGPTDDTGLPPLNELSWIQFRNVINEVRPGTYSAAMTYSEYLKMALVQYLNNFSDFEATCFPVQFFGGVGAFANEEPPKLNFEDHYMQVHESGKKLGNLCPNWKCWAVTVLLAIQNLGLDADPRIKKFGLV
ncbi:hypothetical protein BC830DRAFT_1083151 [Chytriomyces sp. MP71]|nr:hypothetical protein BC830DRAFT_1083151 [Chytriomyces sp. MP71]